jgi:hypothetical protein
MPNGGITINEGSAPDLSLPKTDTTDATYVKPTAVSSPGESSESSDGAFHVPTDAEQHVADSVKIADKVNKEVRDFNTGVPAVNGAIPSGEGEQWK